MLCYTILYYTIVYYTVLWHGMSCYHMLCCAMLCYAMLCYTMLHTTHYTPHYTVLCTTCCMLDDSALPVEEAGTPCSRTLLVSGVPLSETCTPNLPTNITPTNIAWLELSGKSPMGLGISPLKHKIMFESNPLKPTMLVRDWVYYCRLSNPA